MRHIASVTKPAVAVNGYGVLGKSGSDITGQFLGGTFEDFGGLVVKWNDKIAGGINSGLDDINNSL
jgi:hypothetical protein